MPREKAELEKRLEEERLAKAKLDAKRKAKEEADRLAAPQTKFSGKFLFALLIPV